MIFESLKDAMGDLKARWVDLQGAVTDLSSRLASSPTPVAMTPPPSTTVAQLQGQVVSGVANASAVSAGVTTAKAISSVITQSAGAFRAADADLAAFETIIDTALGPTGLDFLEQLYTWPDSQVSSAARLVRSRLDALRRLIDETLQEINEVTTPAGGLASLSGIRGSVDDMSTYPVLTQDFSYGTHGGGPGGGGFGRTVQDALVQVLGRRPRVSDAKSFVAALDRSFTCTQVEGHTICTWTPNAGVGLSELGGAITGAQASLWQQAKGARDNALPLLDRLTPLLPDADPQLTEAVRAIVRTEFEEVVKELGMEGGPRVQRVDDLFYLLLEADFPVAMGAGQVMISSPQAATLLQQFQSGEIGRLGYTFGFTRDQVNTIEEELNLTNFLVLRDYLTSLRASWQTFRSGFVGQADNYLGTQLVLIQRVLGAVAEQVAEVMFAMDSVFLGPAERETVAIEFPPLPGFGPGGGIAAPPRMLVGDLLSWVQAFASDEGPAIITDGGKLGVRTIVPTLEHLRDLVKASIGRVEHPGAQHPRVRRTIEELVGQLEQAARLAGTIS